MKFSHQLATNILLASLLVVLVLIWRRMPPTAGEIASAKGSDRKALTLRQPVVMATITDTIDVNVENSTLDVNVENTGFDANITNPELEVNVSNTLPVPVAIERR